MTNNLTTRPANNPKVIPTPISHLAHEAPRIVIERVGTVVLIKVTGADGREQVYSVNALTLLVAMSRSGANVLSDLGDKEQVAS